MSLAPNRRLRRPGPPRRAATVSLAAASTLLRGFAMRARAFPTSTSSTPATTLAKPPAAAAAAVAVALTGRSPDAASALVALAGGLGSSSESTVSSSGAVVSTGSAGSSSGASEAAGAALRLAGYRLPASSSMTVPALSVTAGVTDDYPPAPPYLHTPTPTAAAEVSSATERPALSDIFGRALTPLAEEDSADGPSQTASPPLPPSATAAASVSLEAQAADPDRDGSSEQPSPSLMAITRNLSARHIGMSAAAAAVSGVGPSTREVHAVRDLRSLFVPPTPSERAAAAAAAAATEAAAVVMSPSLCRPTSPPLGSSADDQGG